MIGARASLPAALLLALLAGPAHGYTLLDGPMPRLANLPAPPKAAGPVLSGPAPMPDPDAFAPRSRAPAGPRLTPALINRSPSAGQPDSGYAAGSAYSGQLERSRGPTATNIGTLLAPALRVTVPLK